VFHEATQYDELWIGIDVTRAMTLNDYYPTLTTEDVRAVIAFAADSVREDLPAPKAVGF
jgi:uncharacterized protein (DUF433 family)